MMVRSIACAALFFTASYLMGQEQGIERRKFDEVEIELFRNTVSISQAIAINHRGSVLGTREIVDDDGATLRSVAFYSGQYGTKDIAIPDTFTNFEPTGISDNELVIGYATRPLRHKDGSLRGIVWNPQTGEFFVLPNAAGDVANQAQDISSDGKRITGYTTGPARMRPVLWEFQDASKEWKVSVLPTLHEQNPYLMSGQLMISPSGKWIAGSCTETFRADGLPDSGLFLWKEDEDGRWVRKKLSDDPLYLRGINDHGEMAGSILGNAGGRQPCYVSPEGEFVSLELLPEDVSGEAKGINNSSVIVGFSDDPPGVDGGPELCVWSKDGKAKRLREPGPCYGAILGINDAGQMAGMIEVSPERENPTSTDPVEELLLAFRTVK